MKERTVSVTRNLKAILIHAGGIVLVEHINKQGKSNYLIINGRKRLHETNKEAACRIVERELGLTIIPDRFETFTPDNYTVLLRINSEEFHQITYKKGGGKIGLWSPESIYKADDVRQPIKDIAHDVMAKLPSNKIL